MKGIYKIINKIDNKYYLGSTNNFKNRKKYHFRYLKYNKHWNKHLQCAYNKYGYENFEFVIVKQLNDNATEEDLLMLEQHFLNNIFKNDKGSIYNSCQVAGKPPNRTGSGGYHLTEDHKNKIAMQRGWKHSDETRKKMSDARRGKTWEEIYGIEGANKKRIQAILVCKNTLSLKRKGCKLSEEHKKKISNKLKGIKISEKCKEVTSKRCSKPVYQIDKHTNKIISQFSSAKNAEINLMGKETKGVSAACLGKQKTAHGYKWKYKEA